MRRLDKRLALIREGWEWYAAAITQRGDSVATFRVSERSKSRVARGEAEQLTNLEVMARRAPKEGKPMRCAPEGERPVSIDLKSQGVTRYMLDPVIAAKLCVAAKGSAK